MYSKRYPVTLLVYIEKEFNFLFPLYNPSVFFRFLRVFIDSLQTYVYFSRFRRVLKVRFYHFDLHLFHSDSLTLLTMCLFFPPPSLVTPVCLIPFQSHVSQNFNSTLYAVHAHFKVSHWSCCGLFCAKICTDRKHVHLYTTCTTT